MTFFGKLWRSALGIPTTKAAASGASSSGPVDSSLVAPKTSTLKTGNTSTLQPTFLDKLKDSLLSILSNVGSGVNKVIDKGVTVTTQNKVDTTSLITLGVVIAGLVIVVNNFLSSKKMEVTHGRKFRHHAAHY